MRNFLRPTRAILAAVIVGSALTLAACSNSANTNTGPAGGSVSGGADHIVIKNFAFDPATLTVKPGAKVTVTNNDSVTHTLTATSGGGFNTGNITNGQTVTFVAPTKPGKYAYDCTIHPFMLGTLIVS